jgi:Rieske Fe-S protein
MIAGACACCAMSADLALAADPPATTAPKTLPIGKATDFPDVGFYDKFAKQKVLVARLDDRLVAMTNVCTHKGCALKIDPGIEPALKCPCHKAEFGAKGTPTAGQAKLALARYALTQGPDGTITADLTKSFPEAKWNEAESFIAMKRPE